MPKDEISRDQLLNLMAGGKELVDLEQEIAKLNNREAPVARWIALALA